MSEDIKNQCQGCTAGWEEVRPKLWHSSGKSKIIFHNVKGGYKGEKIVCTKKDYEKR